MKRREAFPDVDPVRRRMMSAIRSRNTKPERRVRSALHAEGYRFRIHAGWLPGRPDIVFTRRRVVIFVHGCFWHGHSGCKNYQVPKTRTEYWSEKIEKNVRRDASNSARLGQLGWTTAVVWECEPELAWLARLRALLGPATGSS
jgi:DNA mismatch endonuclease (patch repair protein)